MSENNDFRLPKGSLYSPFPIPAYQVLGKAKEFTAQKVLLALVSHMGKNDNAVFPSYATIMKSTGIGKTSVSTGLKVLHEYGFIKIFKIRIGVQSRNKYYLQYACWDSGRMNKRAKPFREVIARCSACGSGLNRGEFDFSPLGKVHWGCGGLVEFLNSQKTGRNQNPSGN